MSLELAILLFTCVVNLGLGLFVLFRNSRLISNIIFFILSISISLWAVTNYLTEANIPLNLNSLFNRLAYLFGAWCVLSITAFCFNFPVPYKGRRRYVYSFFALAFIISVLSVTSLVAGTVNRDAKGLHFTIGSLSTVYAVVLLGLLITAIIRSVRTMRNSPPLVKRQIKFIMFGFIVAVVMGVLLNLIIPTLVSNFETAKYGPLLTVVLVGSISYAIVRYGLFNIRLVVARSVAYALVIVTIGALYTFFAFGLGHILIKNPTSGATSTGQQVINVLVALFLAFSLPYVKRFFDKISNELFYRDNYDPQVMLDQLNQVLVSSIELEPLLQDSSHVLEGNLKSEYCFFALKETHNVGPRTIGRVKGDFEEKDIEYVRHMTVKMKRNVIITDYLEESYEDLKKVLQKYQIAVLCRLSPNVNVNHEGIGYIVLGQKRNGIPYNKQDRQVLEIISNELVIAIQNALRFEEIKQFNLTLQQKVDDATQELRKANDKLRALDETKDEFISMASHQLRTPLTSVKGYVSMVLEGDAGKITANQKKLLDQSFLSAQRMVYLIADLLNVSRLKTGKFVIDAAPTNLADLIEGELEQLKQTAQSREITLTYDKPKDFPMLMFDETKIRQVVMNFADNAIYYTPAGGHININLVDKGDTIEFTVVDDGIGVPKAVQPHLFSKFYRADNAKKARPDGTGLGLFMAKKVVVAQGGAIIFKSEEGKGSTFGFSFSKDKLKIPAKAKVDAKKVSEHSKEPSLV